MTTSLITRHHEDGNTKSVATFSKCLKYRYSLTRMWDETAPRCSYIMLNPSKADEVKNDPTVERCERRARRLGFGSFRVVNIFAFRATDPADLKRAKRPEGAENLQNILDAARWGDMILAAWGAHGDHRDQGAKCARALLETGKAIHHLGLTKYGHPRHPLYVSYAQEPALWHLQSSTLFSPD